MSREALQEEAMKATSHDNEFTFEMTGLSDFTFTIQESSITKGQPWGGISQIKVSQEKCTIVVKAGRKASSAVADWFKTAIGQGSAIGCDTYDALPSQLNFAFKGTMSFSHGGSNYSSTDVVLAQGHNARSRNNWWIGGNNMSEFTKVPIVHLGAISQTFYNGFLPAQVFFVTFLGQDSSINMGMISI